MTHHPVDLKAIRSALLAVRLLGLDGDGTPIAIGKNGAGKRGMDKNGNAPNVPINPQPPSS